MTRPALAGVLAGLLAGGASAAAHHSIAAVYDGNRRVTVTGAVREFRFVNPHPWMTVAAIDDRGREQAWRLELDNLFELQGIGVTADTWRPGDRVIAMGSPSRDGVSALYVRQLDRPADGFRYEQVGTSPRVRIVPR
jgi:hypothetical protein